MSHQDAEIRVLPSDTVVIAGGGPVGLLLSRVLSFYGVKSILFERNKTTTKWPKMDLTNVRSMEIIHKLGLADDLRKQGVPAHFDQNVLVSTGLSTDKPITQWDLPGPDNFRKRILETNDGTSPQEPSQRLSQAIFERWLKAICDKDPNIDLRYGFKVESVVENDDSVNTTVTEVDTGVTTVWQSAYMAGCDGGGSRVRRSVALPLDGGPLPSFGLLVHFKSRDLSHLRKFGRFWHIMLPGKSGRFESSLISQDEAETFTAHLFLPLDAEPDKIGTEEAVYRALGGLYEPYEIKIDEVFVRSVWRPNLAVARTWSGPKGRVYIAGDAAHQNIPTGGYGMNTGVGDAWDLGWKLAAVINGQAGPTLLKSYEVERRPVALRNVNHSGVHWNTHDKMNELLGGGDPKRVDADTDEGHAVRQKIHEHYQANDGENKDFGIEMGYRYTSPVVIRHEDDSEEPPWTPRHYVPTTWPGSRPPHIFLSNGKAIFDTFGRDWTLVVFSSHEIGQSVFVKAAEALSVPLVLVNLSEEEQAAKLYERKLVLIRPDQHVAWRADEITSLEDADEVLRIVTGRVPWEGPQEAAQEMALPAFASTQGSITQVSEFVLDKMGAFQK